jgi:uncharacterized protein DUF4286
LESFEFRDSIFDICLQMIVYNVTTKVDRQIEKAWLTWLKNEHIPAIMATGLFIEYKLFHLLEQEEDGITYIVQYFAQSIQHYQKYVDELSQKFRQNTFNKWGNQFISFRTVMEIVN